MRHGEVITRKDTRERLTVLNMAEQRTPRRRYKEFLRYSNPHKFATERRRNTRKKCIHNVDRSPFVFNELDVQDMFGEEPTRFFDDSSSHERVQKTENSSLSELCSLEHAQELDEAIQLESDEMCDGLLSDQDENQDELLPHNECMYERYVMDDDAASDIFSDCENTASDSESSSNEHEREKNDMLYSGSPITSSSSVVLLLSFVLKHKLTREAFSDLLAVVEAHCPRPNNCRTTVKKLFQFVSEAKGDIVKHFYCSYCNAYYGRGDNPTQVNRTCNICGQGIPTDGRFFIEVPIERQLQKFFTGKCLCFFSLADVLINHPLYFLQSFTSFTQLLTSIYCYLTFN